MLLEHKKFFVGFKGVKSLKILEENKWSIEIDLEKLIRKEVKQFVGILIVSYQ